MVGERDIEKTDILCMRNIHSSYKENELTGVIGMKVR